MPGVVGFDPCLRGVGLLRTKGFDGGSFTRDLSGPLFLVDDAYPVLSWLDHNQLPGDAFCCSGLEGPAIPFARLVMLSPVWEGSTNTYSSPVFWAVVLGLVSRRAPETWCS